MLAVSASNMSAAWSWAARAFDSAKPTRVIVHGFGSNCDNVWVYEMRSALMAVVCIPTLSHKIVVNDRIDYGIIYDRKIISIKLKIRNYFIILVQPHYSTTA